MEHTRTRLYRQISVANPWALALTGLLTLTGCAGKLEEPERFLAAGSTNSSSAPTCLTTAFNQKCSGNVCHSAGAAPAGDLDLTSPNVALRLINKPATFAGVLMGPAVACSPAKLIDTATPSASWLEVKVLGTQGSCGLPMPEIGMLTADEEKCLTDYVAAAGM